MPNTFTPPTVFDVPPILPDTEPSDGRLMKFYGARERGINVWLLPDDTVTQIQPWPLVSPEDAAAGSIPLGDSGTAVTYIKVWYGAHSYEVSDEEAQILTDAGYTVT